MATRRNADNVEAVAIVRFKDVLARLAREFPSLTIEPDFDHPEVDAFASIPSQPGLGFDISINLQYDELHLNAASFWVEWFPCTRQDVAESFTDALCGLISGNYRIVEHLGAGEPVKAQLQRPRGSGWKTIATWYGSILPWPRPKRIVQNSRTGF